MLFLILYCDEVLNIIILTMTFCLNIFFGVFAVYQKPVSVKAVLVLFLITIAFFMVTVGGSLIFE